MNEDGAISTVTNAISMRRWRRCSRKANPDHGVPEQRPDAAIEDEAIFILAVVPMHGSRQGARLHRMFYEREALVSVVPFND
jgi:hypothetical protein